MVHQLRLTLLTGLLALTGVCYAQNEAAKYFHLDFVVKELDGGKVVNTRHYWTTMSTGEHGGCSIRSGDKVPVPTTNRPGPDTGYTYVDVGVNIDCNESREIDDGLALGLTAEVSSPAVPSQSPPVIRQNTWHSKVIVPLNKPTMIFSSDDLASKGQIQVELTAAPVK